MHLYTVVSLRRVVQRPQESNVQAYRVQYTELQKEEPKWNSLHSLPQQSVWPLRPLTKHLGESKSDKEETKKIQLVHVPVSP